MNEVAGTDPFENAKIIAATLFQGEYEKGQAITPQIIEGILDQVFMLKQFQGVDRDKLRLELERRVNVIIDNPGILESDRGHKAWLQERRSQIDWKFWNRYRWYLLDKKGWAPQVVGSLDETTEDILERLEDPTEEGRPFDRRGMVVGHVQSGKTANFTGLVCKAVDAGYKLILVLAGPHNNLRSQTQMRLDEEFLGYDTAQFRRADQAGGRAGVALLAGEEVLSVQSLTTRQPDGDFRMAVAAGMVVDLGVIPTILVVKKNATVLRNVLRFFGENPRAHRDANLNRNVIENIPLLLIDDECDYASVNTKEVPIDDDGNRSDDYDPSKINQLIREILRTFRQTAYVGYTATPFANIFIHSDDLHRAYGPDLFPESFIISLPTPSYYTGPEDVFGLKDGSKGPQPVIRSVNDYETFMPDHHDKNHVPVALCESLKKAIRSYILACAIRRARGQATVHNSMLIHVTRYTAVQGVVTALVAQEVSDLQKRLKYGDGASPRQVRSELRTLWEQDFVPTAKAMNRWSGAESWQTIDPELVPSADKIKILTINGSTQDILDYKEHEAEGLNAIAIGGDKLSRGLTLEGLTVSYYLRASKMYDTLMQMGRWFGYRVGYDDVCRIYTTDELAGWYQDIAAASKELREEFDYMVSQGETPKNYGLRVRSHPVLTITSQVKMRDGETLELSYDGDISETTVFDPAPGVVKRNLEWTDAFVRNLPGKSAPAEKGYYLWDNVPGDSVCKFLTGLRTHDRAPRVNGRRLAEYIQRQMQGSELTTWTVALISRKTNETDEDSEGDAGASFSTKIGGLDVNTTRRTPGQYKRNSHFSIKRIVSPAHEAIDLSEGERSRALELTGKLPITGEAKPGSRPLSGRCIREVRPKERGLLLIYPLDPQHLVQGLKEQDPQLRIEQPVVGFAISFPKSATAVRIEYKVNNVYWNQEYATT